MSNTTRDIASLVRDELARVGDPNRRSALEALLQSPARLSLAWDYGKEGERFDCWQVGCSPERGVLLVYCERGFGPAFPWGVVFGEEGSMGMDSQWHSGLEDAAVFAGLLPAPAGYEAPGPRYADGDAPSAGTNNAMTHGPPSSTFDAPRAAERVVRHFTAGAICPAEMWAQLADVLSRGEVDAILNSLPPESRAALRESYRGRPNSFRVLRGSPLRRRIRRWCRAPDDQK